MEFPDMSHLRVAEIDVKFVPILKPIERQIHRLFTEEQPIWKIVARYPNYTQRTSEVDINQIIAPIDRNSVFTFGWIDTMPPLSEIYVDDDHHQEVLNLLQNAGLVCGLERYQPQPNNQSTKPREVRYVPERDVMREVLLLLCQEHDVVKVNIELDMVTNDLVTPTNKLLIEDQLRADGYCGFTDCVEITDRNNMDRKINDRFVFDYPSMHTEERPLIEHGRNRYTFDFPSSHAKFTALHYNNEIRRRLPQLSKEECRQLCNQ